MNSSFEILKKYHDKKRAIIFSPNLRVHWYDYDNHMIIKDGGFGTIIEVKVWKQPSLYENQEDSVIITVLCDNGSLKEFCAADLDLEDPWE